MSMSSDIFARLNPAKREVRLLQIVPGKWSDCIKLALDVVSLDAEPQYRALSYAWGSNTKSQVITLGDQPQPVTQNIFDALRRLRSSHKFVILWVDALCINQDDNEERSQQVSMMDQIYNSAIEVVIWLGDRLPSGGPWIHVTEGGLENGRTFGAISSNLLHLVTRESFETTEGEATAAFSVLQLLANSDHWDSKGIFSLDGEGQFVVGTSYLPAWDAFMRLMKCSWWSRMWVVQEFVLSQESQLVIGNVAVPGRLMTDFFRSYSTHLPPGSCCHLTVAWKMASSLWSEIIDIRRTIWSINAVRNDWRRNDEDSAATRLRKTTWLLRHKEATDPRDKIYGVLGLVPDIKLIPDYTTDAAETFTRASEFLIRSEKNLMALAGPRMRRSGMPSFVPDLIGGHEDRFFQNTIRRINLCRIFRASNGLELWCKWQQKILSLRGLKVDTVKTISASIPDGQEAEGLLRWEKEANVSCADSAAPYPGGGLHRDAFWRTIIRDMIVSVQEPETVRRATPADFHCYEIFRRWIFATGHLEKSSLAAQRADFEYFRKSFFVATQQETFFTTDRGFFGLALEVQPGDEIWILAGGTVPFLLRSQAQTTKESEHRNMVGDCYVHGMMDGEEACEEINLRNVSLD